MHNFNLFWNKKLYEKELKKGDLSIRTKNNVYMIID